MAIGAPIVRRVSFDPCRWTCLVNAKMSFPSLFEEYR